MTDPQTPEVVKGARRPRGNLVDILGSGALANGRPPVLRGPTVEIEPNPVITADEDGVLSVPEDIEERVDVIDTIFADVEPAGQRPFQLPPEPTDASRAAVLEEAKRRTQAIKKGHRAAVRKAMRATRAQGDADKALSGIRKSQDRYSELMVLNCVKPLTQNVGPSELLEVATTLAVLWALSPRVQKVMNGYADKINETLRYNRSELKSRLSKLSLSSTPEQSKLATIEAQKADRQLMAQTDAALHSEHAISDVDMAVDTIMGLDEGLYRNMRSGVPVDEAREIYNVTLDNLSAEWIEQGLDMGAIRAGVREKMAEEAAEDPEVMARYIRTFRAQAVPGPRSADGSWDGSWFNNEIGRLDSEAMALFEVRAPLDPDQYMIQIKHMAEMDFAVAAGIGPEALADTIAGYQVGWELSDYKVDEGLIGGPAANERSKLGIERSRSMVVAMADDGIHPALRQACVTNGALQGWASFLENNPEHGKAFHAKYPNGLDDLDIQGLTEQVKASSPKRPVQPLFSTKDTVNPQLAEWEANKREQKIKLPSRADELGRDEVLSQALDDDGSFEPVPHESRRRLTNESEAESTPVVPKVAKDAVDTKLFDLSGSEAGSGKPLKKTVIPKVDPSIQQDRPSRPPKRPSTPDGPDL